MPKVAELDILAEHFTVQLRPGRETLDYTQSQSPCHTSSLRHWLDAEFLKDRQSFSLFSVFSLKVPNWAPLGELEGSGSCEHCVLYVYMAAGPGTEAVWHRGAPLGPEFRDLVLLSLLP